MTPPQPCCNRTMGMAEVTGEEFILPSGLGVRTPLTLIFQPPLPTADIQQQLENLSNNTPHVQFSNYDHLVTYGHEQLALIKLEIEILGHGGVIFSLIAKRWSVSLQDRRIGLILHSFKVVGIRSKCVTEHILS